MKTRFMLMMSILPVIFLAACGGAEATDSAALEQPANYDYGNAPAAEPYYADMEEVNALPSTIDAESQASVEGSRTDVNGYEDANYDHLSTFGVDVDTASYTRASNYLQDGQLPPVESVRVEEFVNYFDAGYPTPEDVAFGIYADGAQSPFHSRGTYLLRFGIQGYEVPEVLRMPVSLTFVIDISGSMSDPNKLDLVKDSLVLLVDRLNEADTVGIVVYGSSAKVVLEPTSGDQKQTIKNAIQRLDTGGSTNAEAGLRLGYGLAYNAYKSNGINRVILASDGVANMGQTNASELLRFIKDYANSGITMTSMGFGMGTFNDPFMEELADNGDGTYAYIDDFEEAKRLFVDELTSTLQVIAKDARVQVDFNPEVVAYYRLLGYENRDIADQDFRNDTVDAGELGAGHSVTALYAVQLVPGAVGRVATVQLRWEDPDTYQNIEINGNFNTWDLEGDFSETDPHFQLAVVVAQFAEKLRNSPFGSETSYEDLLAYAYPLTRELEDDPDVQELISLLHMASQISD